MDTDTPRPHDDLSDLERRLSGWRPSAAGLDPDAMLFAAGRASARPGPGRFVWPAVSGCLALLAVALGAGLVSERSERLALAQLVRQQPPAPAVASRPEPKPSPAPAPPPADSYLAARHLLGQNPDAWLARSAPEAGSPAAPPDGPPVLRAWPSTGVLTP